MVGAKASLFWKGLKGPRGRGSIRGRGGRRRSSPRLALVMVEVVDFKELKYYCLVECIKPVIRMGTHGSEQRRGMSSVIEPISSYIVDIRQVKRCGDVDMCK